MRRAVLACLLLSIGVACAAPASHSDAPPPAWHIRPNLCASQAAAADRERIMQTTADRRAATVFAYAECERRRLDAEKIGRNDLRDYAEDVRHARGLYWEAFRTHVSRWEIGSLTRIGDLYLVAAARLTALHVDAKDLTEQAMQAYQWALLHADGAPADVLAEVEVASWVATACKRLGDDAGAKGTSFDVSMCKDPTP